MPRPPDARVVTATGADPAVLRESLARAHGHAELRETHLNRVVLAGDRAYKLPRPVRYDFADQSTPELRRAVCDKQVELNAALAPGLVLGVRAVVEDGDGGYALADADDPTAVDHLVEMRRFDESRTLRSRVRAHAATSHDGAAAGARLAAFHATADRVTDPIDHRALVDRNMEELTPLLDGLVTAREQLAMQRFFDAFLLGWQDVLAARAAAGLVVDGHGDVRAEHVLVEPDGVRIVDRLELDDLRRLDVADELAFLLCDLEALGARGLGEAVLDGYRAAGGDVPPARLLGFFGAYRAQVRAKVLLLRRAEDPRAVEEALLLLRLARRMAWRARGPLTLLVCGPPASGKSTLAAALSRASGLRVLSSDDIRHTVGRDYSAAGRRTVYSELGRLATGERAVIVDATFGDAGLQEAFAAAYTDRRDQPVLAVECVAPLLTREARAELRALRGASASEAGPDIARVLAASHEPPGELAGAERIAIDTTVPIDLQVDQVESWLDTRLTKPDA